MDMIKVNSGKLRAIGYDREKRTLCVELDSGQGFEFANIGESIWQHFRDSGNQWSYYRDNIEEEYTARQKSMRKSASNKNPLDDLFQ